MEDGLHNELWLCSDVAGQRRNAKTSKKARSSSTSFKRVDGTSTSENIASLSSPPKIPQNEFAKQIRLLNTILISFLAHANSCGAR